MIDTPSATHITALQLEENVLRVVSVSLNKSKPVLDKAVETFDENVKPLYIDALDEARKNKESLLVTILSSQDTLVRGLEIKLKKKKDIDAVLRFQIEPHLPYSLEKAVIDSLPLAQTADGTLLTVIAAKKDVLETHLNLWSSHQIEPEMITVEAAALVCFANTFFSSEESYFHVHLGKTHTTSVLIKDKKLAAAQACIINEEMDLKSELARTLLALEKKAKGAESQTILLTGTLKPEKSLFEILGKTIVFPETKENFDLSPELLQKFAIPLGAAIGGLSTNPDPINLRQKEHAYPHRWNRFKKPLGIYFSLCLALSAAFYFFGNSYIGYQEDSIRQDYVSLLSTMNKSYSHFENEYLVKYPEEKRGEEDAVLPPKELTQQEILGRLHYLHKEIQSTPDLFPLWPNIPRVSDVLGWMSNHPTVVKKSSDGDITEKLIQLESFNYTMVKRPEQTKKQEKYQVKVELEFVTSTPKLAREFHDALIAPNEIVDPKGEIKWSSNRGKYRTSFYLKDKTVYPR